MSQRTLTAVILLSLSTTVPAHGMFETLKNFGEKIGFNTALQFMWNQKSKVVTFGAGIAAFFGCMGTAYKVGQKNSEKYENEIKELVGQGPDETIIFTWLDKLKRMKEDSTLLGIVRKNLKNKVFSDSVPTNFDIKKIDEFVVDISIKDNLLGIEEKLYQIIHPSKLYCGSLQDGWCKKLVKRSKYTRQGRKLKNAQLKIREKNLKIRNLEDKNAELTLRIFDLIEQKRKFPKKIHQRSLSLPA